MNDEISYEDDEVLRVQNLQIEYNNYDYSNEYLTADYIDKIYSSLEDVVNKLEQIKQSLNTYADGNDKIDNTVEPKLNEVENESISSSEGVSSEYLNSLAEKFILAYPDEDWDMDSARERIIQLNNNYDGWSFEEQEKYYNSAIGYDGNDKK